MKRIFFKWLNGISEIVVKQFPLFILIILYSIVPAFFDNTPVSVNQLIFLVRQAILPALILCALGNYKRWIWWVVFAVTNMIFLIEISCYFSQHIRFNSVIAILFLQTNIKESTEFISSDSHNILKAFLVWVSIVSGSLLFNFYWQKFQHKLSLIKYPVVSVCLGGIMGLSIIYSPITLARSIDGYKQYFSRIHNNMTMASTYVSYYYILHDTLFNDRINQLEKLANTNNNVNVDMSKTKDDLTIVYVIGESFGRLHSNLYGYPWETNPLMQKEIEKGSAFMFDNIIANSNYTHDVVPYMLSFCDVSAPDQFMNYPLLPAVFKKANYKVAYYDNQSIIGDSKHFDFGCTYFFSNKNVLNGSVDYYNDVNFPYDIDLIANYPPNLINSHKKLIIYHLSGQHVDFFCRFPKEFAKFSAKDYSSVSDYTPKQAETVAAYDNATLFQDYTLSRIMDSLRNEKAVLVFAPDHGEEVYDYRNHTGRDIALSYENIRVFYEVPVYIWVSDKFKQLYPDELKMLRENRSKAMFNSDLVHTVLDFSGINCDYFSPELSLLRDGAGKTNRMIRNINYDRDKDEIKQCKMRFEK